MTEIDKDLAKKIIVNYVENSEISFDSQAYEFVLFEAMF